MLLLVMSAGGVYLELTVTRVPNHGFVALGEIDISDGEALLCVTPQSACCSSAETGPGSALPGNWYFPNGDPVSSDTSQYLYITRGSGVIRLHRDRSGLGERPRGIFRCELPDQTGVNRTLSVGLYAFSIESSGKH